MTPNYELKAKVLETRFPYFVAKISRFLYQIDSIHKKQDSDGFWTISQQEQIENIYKEIKKTEKDIEHYCLTNNISDDTKLLYIQEAQRINHAKYERQKRIANRLTEMLKHKCLFLTFTWSPEYYDKQSDKTRKRYVVEYLSALKCHYIANIDYGAKKGRAHYHAIVQLDCLNIKKFPWKFGNLDFERVRGAAACKKIAKYITKLTNHAIKHTTHGSRVIFDKLTK